MGISLTHTESVVALSADFCLFVGMGEDPAYKKPSPARKPFCCANDCIS